MNDHPLTDSHLDSHVSTFSPHGFLGAIGGPFRWLNRDFYRPREIVSKNVLYEIVDPLVWTRLLNRRASFVHAGAVGTPGGGCLLLLGSGGVGKTTTVLELVRNHGYRYLADDLAILQNATLYRYPKRLQVYAYNAELVPGVDDDLLRDRSPADRAAWKVRRSILGSRAVRRRTSPRQIFGRDRVADHGPLLAVVALVPERTSASATLAQASPNATARQAASVLFDEFWDFLRFLNVASALEPSYPTLADVYALVYDTLLESLSTVACYSLTVPAGTPGREIVATLTTELNLD